MMSLIKQLFYYITWKDIWMSWSNDMSRKRYNQNGDGIIMFGSGFGNGWSHSVELTCDWQIRNSIFLVSCPLEALEWML